MNAGQYKAELAMSRTVSKYVVTTYTAEWSISMEKFLKIYHSTVHSTVPVQWLQTPLDTCCSNLWWSVHCLYQSMLHTI